MHRLVNAFLRKEKVSVTPGKRTELDMCKGVCVCVCVQFFCPHLIEHHFSCRKAGLCRAISELACPRSLMGQDFNRTHAVGGIVIPSGKIIHLSKTKSQSIFHLNPNGLPHYFMLLTPNLSSGYNHFWSFLGDLYGLCSVSCSLASHLACAGLAIDLDKP